ncbi:hypothetical protein PGT21_004511 [Puccinia graminis f. sp. tritici]|uniref:BZIP domain-containing protein n=1 Tax=Puccinia graminis f. sp. tritici TaxID=56615 RepID=A0A5B0PK32_PUCGR|nr:hypothetical protein PGT21_004511 [Puccinia graminis f. sp. tritici]
MMDSTATQSILVNIQHQQHQQQQQTDLQLLNRNNKRKHSSSTSSSSVTANEIKNEITTDQINSSSFDLPHPDSSEQHPNEIKKLTTEKRKAQNRAAQRNFRERKEKQCKKNEENLIIRTEENKKMRELITSLEAENNFLRQHVPESVLEQARKSFPSRPELSTIVIPISAYDEFLSPEQKSAKSPVGAGPGGGGGGAGGSGGGSGGGGGGGGGGGLSESEEHARAATALSSLAAAPIDPLFDPQLQHLAGPSSSSSTLLISANHQPDLIVPNNPSDDQPASSDCNSNNSATINPAVTTPSFSHSDHLIHPLPHDHHHHPHHPHHPHHHHHQHQHHQQFDHHQSLLHDKLFVGNHHS